MQIFECDTKWPICLFDFTMKNKCPNYFRFRLGNLLDSYIIHDYFNHSQTGGDYKAPLLKNEATELLIERNEHICTNQ